MNDLVNYHKHIRVLQWYANFEESVNDGEITDTSENATFIVEVVCLE